MDDINKKIAEKVREKLYSLIQENAVRLGKINIRFTKSNQKNSMERMDAIYSSYERLLRSVPKEIIRIEKTIRLKFLTPIDEKQKVLNLSNMLCEADLILEQFTKKYRIDFSQLGHGEDFDKRIEQTRTATKEAIQSQIDKLVDTLNAEMQASPRFTPLELQNKYGIDGETLNQLNLIGPLQEINTIFAELNTRPENETILQGVHEGIIEYVNIGREIERAIPPAHQVNERKGWKMRVAKQSMNLKELIHSIHYLAREAVNPKDQRNDEIIQKTWKRIEDSIQEHPAEQKERMHSKLKLFYQTFNN